MKPVSLQIVMVLLLMVAPACTVTATVTSPANSYPGTVSEPLQCSEPQPQFITNLKVLQAPQLVEPAARHPFRDPVFGSCMVRVTDRKVDLAEDDHSAGLKNEYSRIQSFNTDGSRLLVRGIEGTWYVYDAVSLEPLGQVPLDIDPRWSARDPNVITYSSETRLISYDLSTGEISLVHDFAADAPGAIMVWTRYEGSPSADGHIWGLMAEDENWLTSAYLVYDLEANKVIATRDLQAWPDDEREADSVTISPLGNYFLVQMDKYCEPGTLGTDDHPCGLMVYDNNLQNGRGLLRIIGHSDTALDAQGREVLIFQDIDNDNISVLNLATGEVTPLWPIDFSHSSIGLHISGRAFNLPGWALISTHNGANPSATWMDDQVFAIELKTNGRIVRLAHTYSSVDQEQEHDYWAEPQASVNVDFTRIVFTTNWGRTGTEEVEMFMIVLPPDWAEKLP